jgi:hypothetical protein
MKGKLNGTTDATTPSGRRSSWQQTAVETCKFRPCASEGSPHAYSTVSFPLATSASASVRFLPFSRTIRSASSSARSLTRAWNLSRTAARALTVRALHPGRARRAARTASSTSRSSDAATLPMVAPVEGHVTGRYSPEAGASNPPFT